MKISPRLRTDVTVRIQRRQSIAVSLSLAFIASLTPKALAEPKVVIISLDGATPRLVQEFSNNGALPPNTGVRLLEAKGVRANQNLTINPSLTAAAHIAIATGSDAATNDVVSNTFRLLGAPNSSRGRDRPRRGKVIRVGKTRR